MVDDNPGDCLLIELMVEGRYLFDAYADAASAIRGIQKSRPDVVLCDIEMPGLGGSELRERLREVAEGVPVIAFTGHSAAADRARFLSAGFDGYVSKPVLSDEQLFDEIERVLAGEV